jgi:hypothetical protein
MRDNFALQVGPRFHFQQNSQLVTLFRHLMWHKITVTLLRKVRTNNNTDPKLSFVIRQMTFQQEKGARTRSTVHTLVRDVVETLHALHDILILSQLPKISANRLSEWFHKEWAN